MVEYFIQVLKDNGIRVKWSGEQRIGIQQGARLTSRKVEDYNLPLLFPDKIDNVFRKRVIEYATVLSCKEIRLKEYVEDYIDKNWIKTLLSLDGEMLEEYIVELATGEQVFCKCGSNALILSHSGKVIQSYWLDMAMERVTAVKNLCKFKQYPIQMKRILSEAINIVRMEYTEYASIEEFEGKVEMDKRESEELAKCDIPF